MSSSDKRDFVRPASRLTKRVLLIPSTAQPGGAVNAAFTKQSRMSRGMIFGLWVLGWLYPLRIRRLPVFTQLHETRAPQGASAVLR
jgi:hypothetical protein